MIGNGGARKRKIMPAASSRASTEARSVAGTRRVFFVHGVEMIARGGHGRWIVHIFLYRRAAAGSIVQTTEINTEMGRCAQDTTHST